MITLHMLVREEMQDRTDEGEDDGIGRHEMTGHQETVETTVATGKIRNVHPRKYGKSGTRIVFENGSALIVTDLYSDVVAAWQGDRA